MKWFPNFDKAELCNFRNQKTVDFVPDMGMLLVSNSNIFVNLGNTVETDHGRDNLNQNMRSEDF